MPLVILMIGMSTGGISHQVMRWGTFLATTPIMLVAGGPYIQSAWASFKSTMPTWIPWLLWEP